MAGFISLFAVDRLFGSKPVNRQKRRCLARSRLWSGNAAGNSILSSAVIHIGRSLLDVITLIPPRFGDWFGQRREDNEAVLFSITQPAESHLRATGAGAGLREDSGRFDEREIIENRHSWAVNPAGRVRSS